MTDALQNLRSAILEGEEVWANDIAENPDLERYEVSISLQDAKEIELCLEAQDHSLAYREAKQLALYLHQKHYAVSAPNWQPLSDLRGVISQIDNMVCGLIAKPNGWQLVPTHPTEEMLDAYWGQTGESEDMRSRVHSRAKIHYHVMLNATPIFQIEAKRPEDSHADH
ncbi:hypothetical protein D3C80_488580 [compost metagenome]